MSGPHTQGFQKANFFSKLDVKAGYWSVHLDEESQDLTTFRTSFGRCCFQWLLLRLSLSQDTFQQGMDNIIEQVPVCMGNADDIAVCSQINEEHEVNLLCLWETTEWEGFVFNGKKCRIKVNQINFFGSVYSDAGIQPDLGRLEDISAIPTPQDKKDLQKLLRLMNNVSAYIPNFFFIKLCLCGNCCVRTSHTCGLKTTKRHSLLSCTPSPLNHACNSTIQKGWPHWKLINLRKGLGHVFYKMENQLHCIKDVIHYPSKLLQHREGNPSTHVWGYTVQYLLVWQRLPHP